MFDREDKGLGKLVKDYFNNDKSISLEVGCGEGDYTVQLAPNYPERNFVGIDIKAARIYIGAKKVLDNNLKNAAFISMRVEMLQEVFKEMNIAEIYIPFPDPHVRRKSAPRRLISPEFIAIYKSILEPGGKIHFKTDNAGLFEYCVGNIKNTDAEIYKLNEDVQHSEELSFEESVTTRYERHYREEGRIIKYVCFGFDK